LEGLTSSGEGNAEELSDSSGNAESCSDKATAREDLWLKTEILSRFDQLNLKIEAHLLSTIISSICVASTSPVNSTTLTWRVEIVIETFINTLLLLCWSLG
jgi:hypothetical protein